MDYSVAHLLMNDSRPETERVTAHGCARRQLARASASIWMIVAVVRLTAVVPMSLGKGAPCASPTFGSVPWRDTRDTTSCCVVQQSHSDQRPCACGSWYRTPLPTLYRLALLVGKNATEH